MVIEPERLILREYCNEISYAYAITTKEWEALE